MSGQTRPWHKPVALVVTALVAITILSIGLVSMYWLYWPYNPASISSIEIASPVHSGGVAFSTITGCKNVATPTKVNRDLVGVGKTNGFYPYPEVESASPVRCATVIVPLVIPVLIPTGTYVLRDTYSTQVNPFRTITKTATSNVFEIVP